VNIQTTNERGLMTALYVCPQMVATSRIERRRPHAAVTPFQGTGLPFAGAMSGTPDVAVLGTIPQLVPIHPGDTARRPPA